MIKKILFVLCLILLVAPVHAKKNKHHKDNSLPPGLQKKVERGKQLPPGWQKKVARGKFIEPSIYIHLEAPPRNILRLLPPPTPGVSFKTIENKVIKLREKDRYVLDVFDKDKLPPPPLPPVPFRK